MWWDPRSNDVVIRTLLSSIFFPGVQIQILGTDCSGKNKLYDHCRNQFTLLWVNYANIGHHSQFCQNVPISFPSFDFRFLFAISLFFFTIFWWMLSYITKYIYYFQVEILISKQIIAANSSLHIPCCDHVKSKYNFSAFKVFSTEAASHWKWMIYYKLDKHLLQ